MPGAGAEASSQAAWVVAVAAAVFSFISPCVLPLIPGYLSMISGLSFDELEQRRAGHILRVVLSCVLFGVGFSVVFVLVGASVGAAGAWLQARETALNVVLGLVVVFFGLFVMGVVKAPFLYRERRLRVGGQPLGVWGAPVLGFAFGFGWTPCLSPQLGMMIALAAKAPPAQGALLFAVFGGTLTVLLVAAGAAFAGALRAFAFLQRHHRVIEVLSGGLLVAIGLLLLTQQWDRVAAWMMRAVEGGVGPS